MTDLYPDIEPYDCGHLEVGDGQSMYWEICGNPDGKPAVVLHGGPGSGCSTGMRRWFDPSKYQIVLFDQRGSGRSTPHASEPDIDLSSNTTHHLINDIELLREYLRVDRWLVQGGSWGSTLALAYAERHPEHVSEIILIAVTTTRFSEIEWLYRDVGPLFPEHHARFLAGVGPTNDVEDLISAYHELLMNPDPVTHMEAAEHWCDWESALVSINPDARPEPRRTKPRFKLAFARIVTHYFMNHAWLEEGILLREASRLVNIPGIMVHGRMDLGAPLKTAWELFRAWPNAELQVIDGAGHSSGDPGMSEALIAATDRFANEL